MFWQEEEDRDTPFIVPENVVDLAFNLNSSASLPVDHAEALARAVEKHLPWFAEDKQAGLHVLHGADSGNGWERPEEADALIHLSKRTKFIMRLPAHRVDEAMTNLEGKTLEMDEYRLELKDAKVRLLSIHSALYARYVVSETDDEEEFLSQCVAELNAHKLKFKKVLCGKEHAFKTDQGSLRVRSFFVADLPRADAVRLQEVGMGPHRRLGCGIFIPHKTLQTQNT